MPARTRLVVLALLLGISSLTPITGDASAGVPVWGDVVRRVATRERAVAITFDDGPREPYTSEILDVLRDAGVHATFFLVGENVERHPNTVLRIVREGHAVGNHTWSHARLDELSSFAAYEEIRRGQDAIMRVTGRRPWLLRPPFGALATTLEGAGGVIARTRSLAVMWSIEARDWDTRSPRQVAVRTLRRVRGGDIVLLHDGGGNRQHVVTASRWVVGNLTRRGFRLVTVPELLELKH